MTAATGTAQLSTGTWAIDPVHSTIGFSVRHLLVSKVRGTFDSFSGVVVVAQDGTPSVSAEIAVDSINTRNEQRDAHVKSADYFDAEQYPTATFTSTGVRPKGDTYLVDGDFTLKGVTKPVTLELEFNGVNPGMGHGEVAGFEASVVLNRKDFGIDIDMPLETGGAVVGDKISHHTGDRSAQAGLNAVTPWREIRHGVTYVCGSGLPIGLRSLHLRHRLPGCRRCWPKTSPPHRHPVLRANPCEC